MTNKDINNITNGYDLKKFYSENVKSNYKNILDMDIINASVKALILYNSKELILESKSLFNYLKVCDSDLSGSDFRQVVLSAANIFNCNLSYIDFYKSILKHIYIESSCLINCNLHSSNFFQATLDNVDLRGSDLTNTDLSECSLSECNLEGIDLNKTILNKVTFIRCNLVGTILENLEGKIYNKFRQNISNFYGVRIRY